MTVDRLFQDYPIAELAVTQEDEQYVATAVAAMEDPEGEHESIERFTVRANTFAGAMERLFELCFDTFGPPENTSGTVKGDN